MDSVLMKACAKVNPFLEVTGKLANGYHTVDSVMQSVDLCDLVRVTRTEGEIRVRTDVPGILDDRRNIAYRAAEKFLEATGRTGGVSIEIEKHIPSEAGMGGGSADGAAVIAALNDLYGTGLSREELWAIGARVGADVPFCLTGGCLRVGGFGEKYVSAHPVPDCWLCVVKPDVGISTPEAYAALDRRFGWGVSYRPHKPQKLLRQLRHDTLVRPDQDAPLYNIFETVTSELAPAIPEITGFLSQHSHGALLSGSGTAIFAVCASREEAERLAAQAAERFTLPFTAVCRPTQQSLIQIESK